MYFYCAFFTSSFFHPLAPLSRRDNVQANARAKSQTAKNDSEMLILSKQMNKDLFYPLVVSLCYIALEYYKKVSDYRNARKAANTYTHGVNGNCWKIVILCKAFPCPWWCIFPGGVITNRVCIIYLSADYCMERVFPPENLRLDILLCWYYKSICFHTNSTRLWKWNENEKQCKSFKQTSPFARKHFDFGFSRKVAWH